MAAALGASVMMDLFMARPLDLRQHAVVVSSMVGKLKEARSPDWSKLFTRGLKWGTAEGTSCARNWVPRSGVGERASGGVLELIASLWRIRPVPFLPDTWRVTLRKGSGDARASRIVAAHSQRGPAGTEAREMRALPGIQGAPAFVWHRQPLARSRCGRATIPRLDVREASGAGKVHDGVGRAAGADACQRRTRAA